MRDDYAVITIKTHKDLFKNNVYLIFDKTSMDAVIIDPSWEADKIYKAVAYYGCNIKGILITHSHYDHVNLAEEISREYGVSVYMGRNEEVVEELRCVDHIGLRDGEVITIGSIEVMVVETKGHTSGSVCFKIGDNMFTGDTLFIEGCGICDSNPLASKLYDSLQKIKKITDLQTKIFPGHTYVCDPGKSMEYLYSNNIYLAFQSKELFVKYRMRKNQSGLFAFV